MAHTRRVSVTHFRQNPTSALEQARNGNLVEITSRGQGVATLTPPGATTKPGRLGCMEGTGRVTGDLLEPMPWTLDG